jgi:hypothetical protein
MNAATETRTNPAPTIACDFVDFTNSHTAIWTARNIHFSNNEDEGCRDDVAANKWKGSAWETNKI